MVDIYFRGLTYAPYAGPRSQRAGSLKKSHRAGRTVSGRRDCQCINLALLDSSVNVPKVYVLGEQLAKRLIVQ
jgi:hypothetical protein